MPTSRYYPKNLDKVHGKKDPFPFYFCVHLRKMQLFLFAIFFIRIFFLIILKRQNFFSIFSFVFCICPDHCQGNCSSHCPGLLHLPFYYPPGYLMLPNLTNQVIKLSRFQHSVRIYSNFLMTHPTDSSPIK